jgi:deoxyribonuclease IV
VTKETSGRGPRLGAHMSIAGGCQNALTRGRDVGCEAVQLFTKNASQWKGKPLTDEDVGRFRATLAETGYAADSLIVHDSYLINLATPDDTLWEKSLAAFGEEIDRCTALGIPYLVTHAGAHMKSGEGAGLSRIAAGIDRVLADRPEGALILLETTAGQGTCLCYNFEQIAQVIEQTHHPERIGVCLDTCHVYAAGYDIASPEGYETTMAAFDRLLGLERLKAVHLNDSKKGLGSRVDRHDHIGQGAIGVEAFRLLLNDPRVNTRPMVLETEKGPDGAEDRMNLATLRGLLP